MFIRELSRRLDLLDWKIPESAIKEVAMILPTLNIQDLKDELNVYEYEQYLKTISMSHETPSHYKWFLYKNLEKGYSIWINEFKKLANRNYGFATTIHNHRYCFASLVLKGSLQQHLHSIENRIEMHFDNAPVIETIKVHRSNSYFINSDQIHSFGSIEDNTITLLIRSKALKSYSESFNVNEGKIKRHYSLASRISDFRGLLNE